MQKQHLRLINPRDAEQPEEPEQSQVEESPLLHLRITGRHGVFLLQRGTDQLALVDTRVDGPIACTCHKDGGDGECEHVAILRACGFLQQAA